MAWSGRTGFIIRTGLPSRTGLILGTVLLGALIAPAAVGARIIDPSAALGSNVLAAASTGPWSAFGAGINSNGVLAIAVSGSDIYVGGEFTDLAGIPDADFIARWSGGAWHSLPHNNNLGGPALNNPVNALAIGSNGDLYVGGIFWDASGIAGTGGFARWNGLDWSAVSPWSGGAVNALAVSGNDLYLAGNFSDAGGVAAADDVARYNTSTGVWSSLGASSAVAGAVFAITLYGNYVVIGGDFLNAGGVANADYLAMFNTTNGAWSSVGSNSSGGPPILTTYGYVYALAVSGSNLYVGGKFGNAGGVGTADCIAKWNGSAWSGLGHHPTYTSDGSLSCASTPVFAIAVYGGSVFVGGAFVDAAQEPRADKIAEFDGTNWYPLGSNTALNDGALNSHVYVLKVVGSELLVGGSFTDAAGIASADRMARWQLGTPPASTRKADGRIRIGTGSYAGNNVYNLTGLTQTKTKSAARGSTITFGISLQNDATTGSDKFKVQATNVTPGSGYTVTYFNGTTNITSAVVAGTWTSKSLAPGATQLIKAKVKVLSGAAVNSNVTRLLTITSVGDATKQDAVKFVGKRS
jgi:hypothetical protein